MKEIEIVVSAVAEVGEGPFWDSRTGIVHWVDLLAGLIHSTHYESKKTTSFQFSEMVGAAIPRAEGGIAAAVQSGFIGFDGNWSVTHSVNLLENGYRMNDAKTDSAGRLWAGSNTIDFVPGTGSLWKLDADWTASEILTGLTLPNGIGWSPDNTTMYLVDSMQRLVLKFPFDPDESVIAGDAMEFAGPECFIGLPDGLAVDTDGHLWIAQFGSAVVSEFDSNGTTLSTINLPTKQPTSCAFVGPGLDKMWITSAAKGLELETDSYAGSIFEVVGFSAPGINVERFAG